MGEPPSRLELLPFRGETFVALDPASGTYQPYAFIGADEGGLARFLDDGRADRRVDG